MFEKRVDFDHGVSAVDTEFVRPWLAASHLIVREQRAAFVDTGSSYSVPSLLAALAQAGLEPEQVDYVFLTHIHLDHAGGAGTLLPHLPRARVVVHPRGASHLAEPGKLAEGTRAVYGEEAFARLYGELRPIPVERILVVEDGQQLRLGASRLSFIHTPGHALHHVCIVDHDAEAIFAGDTFGVSYRELDTDRGEFIFPATTPVHFDPDAAHASIVRLMGYAPRAMYLTHYSRVTDLARLAEDLHRGLDAFVEMAERAATSPDPLAEIKDSMRAHLAARLEAHGVEGAQSRINDTLAMDIELNAKGLIVWLGRRSR